MKKCNACGTLNPSENMFCTNCAASLEDAVHVESKKWIESNKKLIKYVGIGLLIVIIIFAGNQIVFAKSAGSQVMSGLLKMMSTEKQEGHLELSLGTGDPTADDILKDMKIALDFEMNKEDSAVKSELLIKDEMVLEGAFALQDYVIYADLLGLYEDNFYYGDKQVEEYVIQSQQLRDYLKQFSLKGVDVKKYVEIIEDELGKDLYKEKGRVYLELNESNLYDLMEVVLKEAEEDEKLVKILHEESVDILSDMIKDDFEIADMDKDDWESALEDLEDFKDFEEMYEEGISGMLEGLEWMKDNEFQSEFNLVVSFDFNMMNTIKDMEIEFEIENEVVVNALYKDKSEHGFKHFKKEEGIDFEDLMDDEEEVYEVSKDIFKNLADQIEENDTLVEYIEDSAYYEEMESYYGINSVAEIFEVLLEQEFN